MKKPFLIFCLALAACTPPKSVQAGLYDTETSLTTTIQTSDQMLGAACVQPASDLCGKALTWHANFLASAGPAKASILTARAQISNDPANAQSALLAANAVIQQLNQTIQQGIH